MSADVALKSNQITAIGIGATVVVIVIGVLLALVITAVVGRLIILIVVIALGVVIWQQRAEIQDHVNKCELNMSFVGVHVDAPQSVVDKCKQVSRS
jgi:hypothetical protein